MNLKLKPTTASLQCPRPPAHLLRRELSRCIHHGSCSRSAASLVGFRAHRHARLRPVGWVRAATPRNTNEVTVGQETDLTNEEESEEEGEDVQGGIQIPDAPEHVLLVENFLEQASALRCLFDERFADPRETTPERFLWDYWHVPQQYTLVRTPAHLFFPPELYQPLEDALLQFGQEMLGCRSLTHVWLSYYVDGHFQDLHADVPHGPWAFVLSLTNWEERRFDGGETIIMRPEVLDFWRNFDSNKGLEFNNVMQSIPPEFNQLTVFDPRLPHGVRRVEGTKDPRHGRLVLHGWFAEPAPFFTGALEAEEAAEALDTTLDSLYNDLDNVGMALGTITARMHVSGETGEVLAVELLTDTLVVHPSNEEPHHLVREDILTLILGHLGGGTFPTAAADTFITVPFQFQ